MANLTEDTSCSIAPYFKIHDDKLAEFKKLCGRFMEATKPEPGCLHYGFCFDGHMGFCREAYANAEALLAHVENVTPLLAQAAKISDIVRLEVHGPAAEIAKLRGPLGGLKAQFFVLECAFRKG